MLLSLFIRAIARLTIGWPRTLRPSQPTWAVSPPIFGSYHLHTPSSFIIITIIIIIQLESWYSFYCPTEGEKLSWPRHCRNGTAACAQDCIAMAVMINALTAISHSAPRYAILDHCDLLGRWLWTYCIKADSTWPGIRSQLLNCSRMS